MPRNVLMAGSVTRSRQRAFQCHGHCRCYVSRKPANGFQGLAAVIVSRYRGSVRRRTDREPILHRTSLSVSLKPVMSNLTVSLYYLEIV